jgi:hypothetical protein
VTVNLEDPHLAKVLVCNKKARVEEMRKSLDRVLKDGHMHPAVL